MIYSNKVIAWLGLGTMLSGCAYEGGTDALEVGVKDQDIWDETSLNVRFSVDGAKTGHFGATVFVATPLSPSKDGWCTGTLIARDVVLTACHCIADIGRTGVTSNVLVGADISRGPYDDTTGLGAQTTKGIATCNPKAGSENDFKWGKDDKVLGSYDQAIIQLNSAVSQEVSRDLVDLYLGTPISAGLPTFTKTAFNNFSLSDVSEESLIVGYGWQNKDESGLRQDRMAVFLKAYLRRDYCTPMEVNCSDTWNWWMPESQNRGSSHGDSGGPLFFRINGVLKQIGVSTMGIDVPIGRDASVYSPVAVDQDTAEWINSFIKRDAPGSLLRDVGLYGTFIKINDRADLSGDSDVKVVGGAIEVGADAGVGGNLYATSKVGLRERATVNGFVSGYEQPWTQNRTVTGGWTYGPSYNTDVDNMMSVIGQCISNHEYIGGESRTLESPGHPSPSEWTLTPGSYGDWTIRRDATLTLNEPGDYFFDSLIVDAEGNLKLDISPTAIGQIRIYVKDTLMLKGLMIGNAPASRILIAKSQGGLQITQNIRGTVIVPNGDIVLDPGLVWVGAGYTNSIELHQETVFIQENLENPTLGAVCPPPSN